jgi:hypothetical protein
MDPSVFLGLGEQKPIQTRYAERRLGDVHARPAAGHDGKFFFAQANDPWYLEPDVHAAVLDRPLYRAGRMLYPMIAGGFGFLPPEAVVWSLLTTNMLALGLGAFLAAKLSRRMRLSTWLGLAVPLNIGLLYEMTIDGAGIVAYVACLGALVALQDDHRWLASILFAGAALGREVMLAFALGVFLVVWLEERRRLWRLVVTPVATLSVWYLYLWLRVMDVAGTGGGPENFGLPFQGFIQAFRRWLEEPDDLVLNVAILLVTLFFTILALRSRLAIAWGALPFVALAIFFSVNVSAEPFDLSRALAPVFTAAAFVLVFSRHADGEVPASVSEVRASEEVS